MKTAGEKDVTVRLNGKDIEMVPFVENIIRETIVGMMSSLKGYEEDADIEIRIEDSKV